MAQRRKAAGVDTGEMESAGGMRWLLTYADLITLLLAMFIILWVTATQDTTKFKAVMVAFQGVFGKPSVIKTGGQSMLHGGVKGGPIQKFTPLIPLGEKMPEFRKYGEGNGAKPGEINILETSRGTEITLGERLLFDRGSATLKPDFEPILLRLVATLKVHGDPVRIEGHTCNLPIHTAEFPSNWELSTRRATNILRYFVQKGFPADKLSAVGYADTKRLVTNTSEENRKKNRRVTIVVLSKSAQKFEPGAKIEQIVPR